MAGLMDFFQTPAGQGLLAAGFSAAANAGRGGPVNTLGRAGLGGLLAYTGAQDNQLRQADEAQQREVRALQMKKMQADLADEEQARTTAAQYFTPATPGAGGVLDSSLPPMFQTGAAPVPAKPAAFNMEGYAQARMAQNPLEGMKLMAQLQKETPINKLDVKDFTPESVQKFAQTKNYADLKRLDKLHFADTGGAVQGLDPFTGRPVSASPKTGNPFNDLIVSDGAGGFRPNSPLIGAKTSIARAGATTINTADNLGLKPKDRFEMEDKLRSDYNKATGADQDIISTASDISNILKQSGSLKDQAAIYKFAKALDPAGAVREADYAAIVKTAGGLEYLTALANKALTGEQLSPKQREEMARVSNSMAAVAKRRIAKQQGVYGPRAKMYNLMPENIFTTPEADNWAIVPEGK